MHVYWLVLAEMLCRICQSRVENADARPKSCVVSLQMVLEIKKIINKKSQCRFNSRSSSLQVPNSGRREYFTILVYYFCPVTLSHLCHSCCTAYRLALAYPALTSKAG